MGEVQFDEFAQALSSVVDSGTEVPLPVGMGDILLNGVDSFGKC